MFHIFIQKPEKEKEPPLKNDIVKSTIHVVSNNSNRRDPRTRRTTPPPPPPPLPDESPSPKKRPRSPAKENISPRRRHDSPHKKKKKSSDRKRSPSPKSSSKKNHESTLNGKSKKQHSSRRKSRFSDSDSDLSSLSSSSLSSDSVKVLKKKKKKSKSSKKSSKKLVESVNNAILQEMVDIEEAVDDVVSRQAELSKQNDAVDVIGLDNDNLFTTNDGHSFSVNDELEKQYDAFVQETNITVDFESHVPTSPVALVLPPPPQIMEPDDSDVEIVATEKPKSRPQRPKKAPPNKAPKIRKANEMLSYLDKATGMNKQLNHDPSQDEKKEKRNYNHDFSEKAVAHYVIKFLSNYYKIGRIASRVSML